MTTFRLTGPTTFGRVLTWDPDGRADGLLTQQLDDEIRGELAALDIRPAWDNSPLTSDRCAHRWPAEIGGEYLCSLTPGHDPGHEAWAPDGEVVSRHTEPVPKPRRKPTPRPRVKAS